MKRNHWKGPQFSIRFRRIFFTLGSRIARLNCICIWNPRSLFTWSFFKEDQDYLPSGFDLVGSNECSLGGTWEVIAAYDFVEWTGVPDEQKSWEISPKKRTPFLCIGLRFRASSSEWSDGFILVQDIILWKGKFFRCVSVSV